MGILQLIFWGLTYSHECSIYISTEKFIIQSYSTIHVEICGIGPDIH